MLAQAVPGVIFESCTMWSSVSAEILVEQRPWVWSVAQKGVGW